MEDDVEEWVSEPFSYETLQSQLEKHREEFKVGIAEAIFSNRPIKPREKTLQEIINDTVAELKRGGF